jgi:hypothetical protein
MQKRRFHRQNGDFEISAPISIGMKISAGGNVSLNRRIGPCPGCLAELLHGRIV